jgi:hypothetical protein
MAMKQLSKAVALAAMATSGAAMADAPKLSEVLDASGIAITGYVDAAFTRYSIDPKEQQNAAPPNYFDTDKSTFGVKQAGLTIAMLPKEGFGASVNITSGSDADSIHSVGGSNSSNFDVTQAWVQYATGPFTAMAGKFNTLAGAEVISPTGNTNISRSIAFLYALPFTHTGARVAYAPLDTLTLYAGINNGWDVQKDTNNSKTLELGAAWNATDWLSWTLQGYRGTEFVSNGATASGDPKGNRTLIDTVITLKPIKELAFIVNYDYGKQENAGNQTSSDGDATWKAIVGYVNYQFTDEWRVSLRAEQFDDADGYRFGSVDLSDPAFALNKKTKEVTLTVGYAPTANFEVRGEVRQDKGDKEIFVKTSDPVNGDSTTDKSMYYAVEALYKF